MNPLRQQFGNIDIYLFDQILRGRITPDMQVLDAGCGTGRNLVYLMQNGFDVYGVDTDQSSVMELQRTAASINPALSANHFRVESLASMSFTEEFADVVICSAVLHFAYDDADFSAMLNGAWRVLKAGGLFFCRLASSIGMESRVVHLGDNRFRLPDGSTRYLVTEQQLLDLTHALGADLLDPIKTTIVQNQRCMTTWVCRKS